MIRTLKTNTPINYILMFVLMLIFWTFKFFYMPTAIESYEAHSLIFSSVPETTFFKYFSAIFAFAAFYSIGILLVKINSDLLIVESAYQSPGVIFALLTGFFINSQRITPVMISGILVFLSVVIIMYSYKKYKAYSNCFNSGLVFAIAILIYPKLVAFLPLLIIALFITKTVEWREIVILFMGILSPLILFFSLIGLYGNISDVWKEIQTAFSQSIQTARYSAYYALILSPFILLTIAALISKYTVVISKKVSTRKFQTLIAVILLFFFVYFIAPIAENESVILLYAPVSLLISNVVINSGKRTSRMFLYGIFVFICFTQFFQISFYLSVF